MKEKLIAAGLVLMMAPFAAFADDAKATEVISFVKKAIGHIKTKGVDEACKDFADPTKGFQKGDLYLFVQSMDAKMVCNAGNGRLNGKSMQDLKDANGKAFNNEMIDIVNKKGSGWVDYVWVNPASQKLQPKTSYVEGSSGYLVGMGYFK